MANIRKFSRAIVEPDAVAVFMNQGQVMGVLNPGQHTLDASELPFLGMFVVSAVGLVALVLLARTWEGNLLVGAK